MAILIVNITEKCNSNCRYCRLAGRGRRETMSLETVALLFKRIDEYLGGQPDVMLEVQLHGGEPLLAGKQFFLTILDMLRDLGENRAARIEFSMQSNLTQLTPEFCEIVAALGIRRLGTSFDPEPGIRGPGRKVDTAHYNRDFMAALPLLERHGIDWGVIYVVTKKALAKPLDIFYFLTNLAEGRPVNLVPTIDFHNQGRELVCSPGEYVGWLNAIAGRWYKSQDRYPNIEPFRSHLDQLARPPGCRDLVRDCAVVAEKVAIDQSGVAHPARQICNDSIDRLGDLLDMSLAQLLEENERQYLEKLTKKTTDAGCEECPCWEICLGGTSQDAFSQNMLPWETGEWCRARLGFFEQTMQPLREGPTIGG